MVALVGEAFALDGADATGQGNDTYLDKEVHLERLADGRIVVAWIQDAPDYTVSVGGRTYTQQGSRPYYSILDGTDFTVQTAETLVDVVRWKDGGPNAVQPGERVWHLSLATASDGSFRLGYGDLTNLGNHGYEWVEVTFEADGDQTTYFDPPAVNSLWGMVAGSATGGYLSAYSRSPNSGSPTVLVNRSEAQGFTGSATAVQTASLGSGHAVVYEFNTDVYLRTDSSGAPVRVNQTTTGTQSLSENYLANNDKVATLADGGLVVVWNRPESYYNEGQVWARVYGLEGQPRTGELLLNTGGRESTVVALDTGGFAVAWWGVYPTLQVFDANGVAETEAFAITRGDANYDGGFDMLDLGGGRILFGYTDYAQPIGQVIDLEIAGLTRGTAAADALTGTEDRDRLHGLADGDTLNGLGGSDDLFGGEGGDTLRGGAGNDLLDGGAGDDRLEGGSDADVLRGGAGNDTYVIVDGLDGVFEMSGGGVDTVLASLTHTLAQHVEHLSLTGSATINGTGNSDANTITGNSRANTLKGLAGDDTLIGGAGNDTLDGGEGNDTLGGGLGVDYASYATALSGVTVSLGLSDAQATGGAGVDTLTAVENLTGSAFADDLTGDGGNNILSGGSGEDTLEGGGGDDTLQGGTNLDTARYRDAAAAVTVDLRIKVAQDTGGAGVDTLSLIERLWGSRFGDTLDGDDGRNQLTGDAGDDTLNGHGGVDSLFGGAGVDTLNGGEGADSLRGEGERDVLNGEGDADMLFGGDGADELHGGDGNDTLVGEDHNDLLTGGAGADTLWGQGGADRFVFRSVEDSTVSALGRDVIRDFSRANRDKVDLSAIDAVSGGTDDAFTLVLAFTGTPDLRRPGELTANVVNGVVEVLGDVNGDGTADFAITVTRAVALEAIDFIL